MLTKKYYDIWLENASLCVLPFLLAILSFLHTWVNTCSMLITYSPAVTLRANRLNILTSHVLPTQCVRVTCGSENKQRLSPYTALTHWHTTFYNTWRTYIYIYIYGAPILDVSRSHTTTQQSRQDSSGRVISSSQRPLPDNTRHSQQTNIHAPGGIRTQDLSR